MNRMGESDQKSGWSFWELIPLVCLLGFVAAVVIPKHYDHYPNTSPANACINNLRQIDTAINEWARENGKTNGTVVTENDIKPYIKLNSKSNVPGCPSGGKYIYGKVGDIPQITCSLSTATPAHKLP
jgi:hypothetical protein